jgi:protein-S-isoprenylcysteine O-methyltransferase Ste14
MAEEAIVAPPPQAPLLKRAFGNRTGAGFLGGAALIATAMPGQAWFGFDQWLLVGGVVACVGAIFRIWASGYLEKNVTVAKKGPYRLVRHPLYVGSIILWIGLLLMAGNLWFAAIAGIGFFGYHIHAIRREETFLVGKFGEEYESFRRETPALLPLLSLVRLPQAILDGGFSLGLAWRHREWHVPLALGGFWVALWAYVRFGVAEGVEWWADPWRLGASGALGVILLLRLVLFAVIDKDIQNPVGRFLIALVSRKGRRDRAQRLRAQQEAAQAADISH